MYALELCPLNLYFLYNNPAEVCGGQRPPFFDMKSIRKVFGWRLIYVNQLLFFTPHTAAASAVLSVSLTYSESLPSADNTPNNRWATAGRKEIAWPYCLPSPPSLFFTNKGFFNKLKGPLPWPIEKMKGGSEVWYNVAGKKEQLIRK